MLDKVRATITRFSLLDRNDGVVVGVSGGPDSVALLHVLLALREELELRLHVAHLNHLFRGAEAEEDAVFVAGLAKAWGLPVTVETFDVPALVAKEGVSAQEAARRVRYGFLRRVAASAGAAKVAVGHHADDQAETVLIHLLRGTGPKGLGGMAPAREGIIRPLLEVTRAEIENYCREHHLPTRLDRSNEKTVYRRNRVRLCLMPVLKEYNPRMVEALTRLAAVVRDEDEYLDRDAYQAFLGICLLDEKRHIAVSLPGFLGLPDALKRRVIRRCYSQIRGQTVDLSYDHVEVVLALAKGPEAAGETHMPGGVRAKKGDKDLSFYRYEGAGVPVPDYCLPLVVPGYTLLPAVNRLIRAEVVPAEQVGPMPWLGASRGDSEAFLDYGLVQGHLYVRRRRPGDRFQPLGFRGMKKLQDFFIDVKVPRQERDQVPVVATEREILWVAGFRPDERFRIGPATKQVLHLEMSALDERRDEYS